ncbi:MAG: hypothetical protein Phog2KO_50480 [Phototrophicaceae bacterium]
MLGEWAEVRISMACFIPGAGLKQRNNPVNIRVVPVLDRSRCLSEGEMWCDPSKTRKSVGKLV